MDHAPHRRDRSDKNVEMTALELLTMLLAMLALVAAMTLSIVSYRLTSLVRELSRAVEAFEEEAVPAAAQLRRVADAAVDDIARVEALLDVSESIGARVDSASEATYRVLTSPIIKGFALASGTKRAAERLRGS